MRLKFILPLPPSVNHQYNLKGGLMTLSNDAQVYRRTLIKALQKLKASGKLSTASFDTPKMHGEGELKHVAHQPQCPHRHPLSICYEFFLRSLGERDLDNGVKLVQDAICEALKFDDRDVVEIYMAKRIDRENPRLIVTIKLLDYWDSEGERSLFRQPEDADAEFDLLASVKRGSTKYPKTKATNLSSLKQLIERFNWE
ncbi:MAG: RusA family crossover junction endodeoxyribonuclease [Armatimonadota bacterium]|nr:RusA family crossover junction endodeoxyribonuclease [Armatimonadota bacterium]MDW8025308.1 RusA family crossover junction endodeoxyribonuclease [Armatimonadota bacterium]